MRLKKVEIIGFKSFKDKLTVQIADGVTAIVGPNGCGKSNIVDAIKWALGEQNPRHLRARDMVDIIFAGASEFAPLGMAEVSLFFERAAVPFPEPYSNLNELSITRRLYRSGESEYLINRSSCRLKDITDITLDTGLGQRFYGLIEQGMVESFMNYKPDEKRLIFEEVAGTAKYRVRKRAAVQKLDQAQQNLDRVEDIIGEVERRHVELEKEAKRAVEYKAVFDQLRRIELFKSARTYERLHREMGERQEAFTAADEEAGRTELVVQAQDAELEARRNELFLGEQQQEDYRRQAAETTEALKRVQREFYALNEGAARRTEKIAELGERKSLLDDAVGGLAAQAADAEANVATSSRKLGEQEARVNDLLQQEREALRQGDALAAQVAQKQKVLSQDQHQLAHYNAQIEFGQKRQAETVERIQTLAGELTTAETDILTAKERLDELNRAAAELQEEKRSLDADIEELQGKARDGRTALQQQRALLQDAERKRERSLGTLASVKRLLEEYQGFSNAARHVLKDFPKDRVLGPLVEHVDVPAESLPAFEGYLRDSAEVIIVGSSVTAREILAHLRQNSLGSCYLLPLDLAAQGASGGGRRLSDAITVTNDALRGPLGNLLSRIRLVADIDEALALYAEDRGTTSYVTADGTVLDSSGVIYGGSGDKHNPFLAEKNRLKEIEAEAAAFEQQAREASERLKATERSIQETEEMLRIRRDDVQNCSLELSNNRVELRHQEEEVRRRTARRDNLKLELKNLEMNLAAYEKNHATLQESIARATDGIAAAETAIAALMRSVDDHRLVIEALRRDTSDARVILGELRSAHGFLQENVASLKERHGKMLQEGEELEREIATLRSMDAEATQRLEQHRAENERLTAEDTRLTQESARNDEQVAALRSDLREREKVLAELRRGLEKLRKTASDCKDRLSDISVKVQVLDAHLRDKYFVEIAQSFEEFLGWDIPASECTEAKIDALSQQLKAFGDVNLLAIDEFEEVRARFEFLTTQRNDLIESIRALNDAIDRINKVSVEMFMDSLKNVEQHFDKIFKRLFGGGKARIVLVDESNPLESGVDIAVELPNKKVQSLSLFSGGEKAMITIALIFAFYLQKPSPFCVLDEVDAPLDDANTLKYREVVREMSQFSQFLVVTHNKLVMETTKTLYGVTQEVQGISKLIAVKTERAAQDVYEGEEI